ncbi:nucleoside/nucleotide kinase family protein [Aureispira anguillae]|uniref:Uridine kinase n=1 Tax=Aureispira anguillae TaxID=2864201 RepID=A0A915YDK4_9BACT|nr:hypothetical protein [Aureispira anguillae]BDS11147.1 hypothetical protein AsAng_0018580 [Aureispira anguillae]
MQQIIFEKIRERITSIQKQKNKAVRIAINGVEGVGKTTFAIALCQFLQSNELNAFHISIDGFHFNKAHRYQQGRNSAKGYYEDSYNEVAFVNEVLLASQKALLR